MTRKNKKSAQKSTGKPRRRPGAFAKRVQRAGVKNRRAKCAGEATSKATKTVTFEAKKATLAAKKAEAAANKATAKIEKATKQLDLSIDKATQEMKKTAKKTTAAATAAAKTATPRKRRGASRKSTKPRRRAGAFAKKAAKGASKRKSTLTKRRSNKRRSAEARKRAARARSAAAARARKEQYAALRAAGNTPKKKKIKSGMNKAAYKAAKKRNQNAIVLAGSAPLSSLSSKQVEQKAEAALSRKDRIGASLRAISSRRALKINVVAGQIFGLADSTLTMAKLDAASVSATGVGYKAWVGLGTLAVGAVAEYIMTDPAKGSSHTKMAAVADIAYSTASLTLGLESYNLGVTRWRKPRQVTRQLLNLPALPEPAEVTGVRGLARRENRRWAGASGAIRRGLVNEIDVADEESVNAIADLFGIDEETQEAIYGVFGGGLPLANVSGFAAPVEASFID